MHAAFRPRLLIVKLSSLGDLFNPLPAVRLLKSQLEADVDWVTQSEYAALVRCFDDVTNVIAFPRRGFMTGLAGFLKQLRAQPYDMILDMQGLLKSGLITGLARGRAKIGPSFAREGAHFFYTTQTTGTGRDRHAVDQCLDSVNLAGVSDAPKEFPVTFPESKLETPSPRVALVPCSRWPAKNWPLERFAEAGRILQTNKAAALYLIGGPDDAEACAALEEAVGGAVTNTCGRLSLAELGGVLKQMDLVITNDSGPMHMASAAGTRVLGLFGPTDPARTGPYGPQHTIIQAPSFRAGNFNNRDYKQADNHLMREITVERVFKEALNMLQSP